MKKLLIVLSGPTSVGKTEISLLLAKKINGEIINADSKQVFKYMDIGTNKIKYAKEEIKHYMFDIVEPYKNYNVFLYQKDVKNILEEIYSKNKIPILVGGSGFYIQAITKNIEFKKYIVDCNYIKNLEKESIYYLYNLLLKIDPDYCKTISKNNKNKIIRALEYFKSTNEKFSYHNNIEYNKKTQYDLRYFVLNDKREKLYSNIEKRVDNMITNGLVEEVENLKKICLTNDYNLKNTIGYKEILEYLNDKISLEEAIYKIKLNTRHYLKRQITWFRHEKDLIWINKYLFENNYDIIKYMTNIIF